MIVITPLHVMCFPKRAVTPGWGKKRFNCRAWEYIYSIFQEIRTPSTELKQSVDLSRNIQKFNSRHAPENFAEQQKSQQNGQELKGNYLLTLCRGMRHSSSLLTHIDHFVHLLASQAVQYFKRYLHQLMGVILWCEMQQN